MDRNHASELDFVSRGRDLLFVSHSSYSQSSGWEQLEPVRTVSFFSNGTFRFQLSSSLAPGDCQFRRAGGLTQPNPTLLLPISDTAYSKPS